MIKSYKVMLLPNDKQKTRLFQFAGTARFAYNWALEKQMTAFENGEKFTFDGLNWWLSVSVEVEELEITEQENFNDVIGIDLGVKDLAILSDRTVYSNINKTPTIRKINKKIRRLQRRISRKYEMNKEEGGTFKKTRSIIKSERQLLKLHHRLKNIRQNYIHQVTTAIINRKPKLIALEDLNIQGMMKNRHLARAVAEQNLYLLRTLIERKAADLGIEIKFADRFYPSSKTCSKCGYVRLCEERFEAVRTNI